MAVLIEVRKGDGTVIGRCDERCYNAIGSRCDCCCGGANHGKGLNRAISNLSRMYDNFIMANFLEGSCPEKVVRPTVEPVLFEYEKERKPLQNKKKPQKQRKKAAPEISQEAQG